MELRLASGKPADGVDHVAGGPSGHHAIETQNHQRRHDAHHCHKPPKRRAVNLAERAVDVRSGGTSDNEFGRNHRDANQKDASQIDYKERSPSVHACLVGETPYVAQPYGRAHGGGNHAQTGCELGAAAAAFVSVIFLHSII